MFQPRKKLFNLLSAQDIANAHLDVLSKRIGDDIRQRIKSAEDVTRNRLDDAMSIAASAARQTIGAGERAKEEPLRHDKT